MYEPPTFRINSVASFYSLKHIVHLNFVDICHVINITYPNTTPKGSRITTEVKVSKILRKGLGQERVGI